MSTHTGSGSHVSIQTSPQSVPSTPPWFGEVAIMAHSLKRSGLLFTEQIRKVCPYLGMPSYPCGLSH